MKKKGEILVNFWLSRKIQKYMKLFFNKRKKERKKERKNS